MNASKSHYCNIRYRPTYYSDIDSALRFGVSKQYPSADVVFCREWIVTNGSSNTNPVFDHCSAENQEKKRTRRNKSNNNKKAKRETGRIKFFNTAKQYGFITREDASDLYVQQRSLGPNVRPQHLTTGQVVTFEVAEVRGQKIARDVRVHKQET